MRHRSGSSQIRQVGSITMRAVRKYFAQPAAKSKYQNIVLLNTFTVFLNAEKTYFDCHTVPATPLPRQSRPAANGGENQDGDDETPHGDGSSWLRFVHTRNRVNLYVGDNTMTTDRDGGATFYTASHVTYTERLMITSDGSRVRLCTVVVARNSVACLFELPGQRNNADAVWMMSKLAARGLYTTGHCYSLLSRVAVKLPRRTGRV